MDIPSDFLLLLGFGFRVSIENEFSTLSKSPKPSKESSVVRKDSGFFNDGESSIGSAVFPKLCCLYGATH